MKRRLYLLMFVFCLCLGFCTLSYAAGKVEADTVSFDFNGKTYVGEFRSISKWETYKIIEYEIPNKKDRIIVTLWSDNTANITLEFEDFTSYISDSKNTKIKYSETSSGEITGTFTGLFTNGKITKGEIENGVFHVQDPAGIVYSMETFVIPDNAFSGKESSVKDTDKNTLKFTRGGKEKVFYLNKAHHSSDDNSTWAEYFTLENGQKGERISMRDTHSKRDRWSIIYKDGVEAYVGVDKDVNVVLDSEGENNYYSGVLDLDVKGCNITGMKFNYTVGEVHDNMKDIEEKTKLDTYSHKYRAQNDVLDDYNDCKRCAGLGICDKYWGEGTIDCNRCASGRCMQLL